MDNCTWIGTADIPKRHCDQSKPPTAITFGYKIELHNRSQTWKDFLETLAHEMVHQLSSGTAKDPHNRNCNFHAWREKFARYGMKLIQYKKKPIYQFFGLVRSSSVIMCDLGKT